MALVSTRPNHTLMCDLPHSAMGFPPSHILEPFLAGPTAKVYQLMSFTVESGLGTICTTSECAIAVTGTIGGAANAVVAVQSNIF